MPAPLHSPSLHESPSQLWSIWAEEYGRLVWLRLVSRQIPPERAKELAQEVWETLFRRWRAGELEDISMPGLALRQADFLALSEKRRRRERLSPNGVEQLLDHSSDGLDSEQQAVARARVERIIAEVSRCSPSTQRVFELTYRPPGLSARQVGDKLGLSEQRVRQILCELRQRVRRLESSC